MQPSTPIQFCLDQIQANTPNARNRLLQVAQNRLLEMVRGLLRKYPQIRRWEGSEDVLQNVLIRLTRCLEQTSITSTRDFLNLAGTNIRREVIDLLRRHYGSRGIGANHATPGLQDDRATFLHRQVSPKTQDPSQLAEFLELQERIAQLPEAEREVFHLQYYVGLTQPQIAELLGISTATVKRRYLTAVAHLGMLLQDYFS